MTTSARLGFFAQCIALCAIVPHARAATPKRITPAQAKRIVRDAIETGYYSLPRNGRLRRWGINLGGGFSQVGSGVRISFLDGGAVMRDMKNGWLAGTPNKTAFQVYVANAIGGFSWHGKIKLTSPANEKSVNGLYYLPYMSTKHYPPYRPRS